MTTYDTDAALPGSDEHTAALQATLLAWWDAGHRDLPWRRTRDPYAILVSELMLQQTQVDRVIPKWHAFMARFPTIAALAEAPAGDVIRAWAGLGYNRRAINLHRLAQLVHCDFVDMLPDDVSALRNLPGIGPYTARAVASIAFGRPAAVVDTNVRRVLTRVVDGVESTRTPAQVQALADQLLAREQSGDWNQALMELGAVVCGAASPRCGECPVRRLCAAAPAIREVREHGIRYRAPRQAKPQGTYEHSNRFYRGRILDALRAEAAEATLIPADIGHRLRLDFTEDDLPWLGRLLTGLARDGLITWGGGDTPVSLPA